MDSSSLHGDIWRTTGREERSFSTRPFFPSSASFLSKSYEKNLIMTRTTTATSSLYPDGERPDLRHEIGGEGGEQGDRGGGRTSSHEETTSGRCSSFSSSRHRTSSRNILYREGTQAPQEDSSSSSSSSFTLLSSSVSSDMHHPVHLQFASQLRSSSSLYPSSSGATGRQTHTNSPSPPRVSGHKETATIPSSFNPYPSRKSATLSSSHTDFLPFTDGSAPERPLSSYRSPQENKEYFSSSSCINGPVSSSSSSFETSDLSCSQPRQPFSSLQEETRPDSLHLPSQKPRISSFLSSSRPSTISRHRAPSSSSSFATSSSLPRRGSYISPSIRNGRQGGGEEEERKASQAPSSSSSISNTHPVPSSRRRGGSIPSYLRPTVSSSLRSVARKAASLSPFPSSQDLSSSLSNSQANEERRERRRRTSSSSHCRQGSSSSSSPFSLSSSLRRPSNASCRGAKRAPSLSPCRKDRQENPDDRSKRTDGNRKRDSGLQEKGKSLQAKFSIGPSLSQQRRGDIRRRNGQEERGEEEEEEKNKKNNEESSISSLVKNHSAPMRELSQSEVKNRRQMTGLKKLPPLPRSSSLSMRSFQPPGDERSVSTAAGARGRRSGMIGKNHRRDGKSLRSSPSSSSCSPPPCSPPLPPRRRSHSIVSRETSSCSSHDEGVQEEEEDRGFVSSEEDHKKKGALQAVSPGLSSASTSHFRQQEETCANRSLNGKRRSLYPHSMISPKASISSSLYQEKKPKEQERNEERKAARQLSPESLKRREEERTRENRSDESPFTSPCLKIQRGGTEDLRIQVDRTHRQEGERGHPFSSVARRQSVNISRRRSSYESCAEQRGATGPHDHLHSHTSPTLQEEEEREEEKKKKELCRDFSGDDAGNRESCFSLSGQEREGEKASHLPHIFSSASKRASRRSDVHAGNASSRRGPSSWKHREEDVYGEKNRMRTTSASSSPSPSLRSQASLHRNDDKVCREKEREEKGSNFEVPWVLAASLEKRRSSSSSVQHKGEEREEKNKHEEVFLSAVHTPQGHFSHRRDGGLYGGRSSTAIDGRNLSQDERNGAADAQIDKENHEEQRRMMCRDTSYPENEEREEKSRRVVRRERDSVDVAVERKRRDFEEEEERREREEEEWLSRDPLFCVLEEENARRVRQLPVHALLNEEEEEEISHISSSSHPPLHFSSSPSSSNRHHTSHELSMRERREGEEEKEEELDVQRLPQHLHSSSVSRVAATMATTPRNPNLLQGGGERETERRTTQDSFNSSSSLPRTTRSTHTPGVSLLPRVTMAYHSPARGEEEETAEREEGGRDQSFCTLYPRLHASHQQAHPVVDLSSSFSSALEANVSETIVFEEERKKEKERKEEKIKKTARRHPAPLRGPSSRDTPLHHVSSSSSSSSYRSPHTPSSPRPSLHPSPSKGMARENLSSLDQEHGYHLSSSPSSSPLLRHGSISRRNSGIASSHSTSHLQAQQERERCGEEEEGDTERNVPVMASRERIEGAEERIEDIAQRRQRRRRSRDGEREEEEEEGEDNEEEQRQDVLTFPPRRTSSSSLMYSLEEKRNEEENLSSAPKKASSSSHLGGLLVPPSRLRSKTSLPKAPSKSSFSQNSYAKFSYEAHQIRLQQRLRQQNQTEEGEEEGEEEEGEAKKKKKTVKKKSSPLPRNFSLQSKANHERRDQLGAKEKLSSSPQLLQQETLSKRNNGRMLKCTYTSKSHQHKGRSPLSLPPPPPCRTLVSSPNQSEEIDEKEEGHVDYWENAKAARTQERKEEEEESDASLLFQSSSCSAQQRPSTSDKEEEEREGSSSENRREEVHGCLSFFTKMYLFLCCLLHLLPLLLSVLYRLLTSSYESLASQGGVYGVLISALREKKNVSLLLERRKKEIFKQDSDPVATQASERRGKEEEKKNMSKGEMTMKLTKRKSLMEEEEEERLYEDLKKNKKRTGEEGEEMSSDQRRSIDKRKEESFLFTRLRDRCTWMVAWICNKGKPSIDKQQRDKGKREDNERGLKRRSEDGDARKRKIEEEKEKKSGRVSSAFERERPSSELPPRRGEIEEEEEEEEKMKSRGERMGRERRSEEEIQERSNETSSAWRPSVKEGLRKKKKEEKRQMIGEEKGENRVRENEEEDEEKDTKKKGFFLSFFQGRKREESSPRSVSRKRHLLLVLGGCILLVFLGSNLYSTWIKNSIQEEEDEDFFYWRRRRREEEEEDHRDLQRQSTDALPDDFDFM
ncbi:hypothetical protein CSUI_009849 [Cystoisospora suis]|uniref:Transmembrane protein n=1 Tax=Cystoisospora suis TaxID=483139 RepID=A0A2C6KFM9_9APIC|nr:hypothetical protein CSUI_009849 [Cystoisospora suis]